LAGNMSEFIISCAVIFCGVSYWLGGQEIPWTKRGYKWLRRFLLPIGLFIFLIVLGAIWWKALIACVGLSAALHLGYQSSLIKYALCGLAYGLPALIFGFQWTIFLPAAFHTLFGSISLRDNNFKWSYIAILEGISIGVCYTYFF